MKPGEFSDEQILAIVKEGEAGRKVADLCRANWLTEQTYYRWKAKCGGMELSELQRLKQVEDENRCLKHIVCARRDHFGRRHALANLIGQLLLTQCQHWIDSRRSQCWQICSRDDHGRHRDDDDKDCRTV